MDSGVHIPLLSWVERVRNALALEPMIVFIFSLQCLPYIYILHVSLKADANHLQPPSGKTTIYTYILKTEKNALK